MTRLLEARSITRRHGRGATASLALAGVDLDVDIGEHIAVMGPSGSGKSSLLNVLALLDPPTSGLLRFRGEDVKRLSADERARLRGRHIGFVFQSYHLLPRRSAAGNVELPLLYAGVSRAERRRRVAAALDMVGLAARAEAMPSELSGGEQQRVAIARALVADPELIVADEPTGALDSRTSELVLDLLDGVVNQARTLVVVTHDPLVAARAARIVELADGRVTRDRRTAAHAEPATDAFP